MSCSTFISLDHPNWPVGCRDTLFIVAMVSFDEKIGRENQGRFFLQNTGTSTRTTGSTVHYSTSTLESQVLYNTSYTDRSHSTIIYYANIIICPLCTCAARVLRVVH